MAGHDAGSIGDALNDDGEEPVDDLTNCICCYDSRAHMAQNDTYKIASQPQQSVTDQHGNTETEIAHEQRTLHLAEQVREAEMQGAVTEEDVAECHKKFRDTSKKRSECGTGYLHPWRAEFAKDEDIVGNQD